METIRPHVQESRFDLRNHWRVLVRRKWWFLLPLVAAVISGAIFAYTADPVYQSTALLLYERAEPLTQELGRMVQAPGSDDDAARMYELITSTRVLRQVITLGGLTQDPALRAEAERARARHPGLTVDQIVELRLIHHLRELIQVVGHGRTDVYSISLEDTDPERAQRVTNALADTYVSATLSTRLDALRATSGFGVEQLNFYREQLDTAERRVAAFQAEMLRSEVSDDVVSGANVTILRALINAAELDASDARKRADARRASVAEKGGTASLVSLFTSPSLSGIIARLDSLEEQGARADLNSGQHEAASDLERSLRVESVRARRELEQELRDAALASQGADADVEDLVGAALVESDAARKAHRRDYLTRLLRAHEGRAISAPDREIRLADLEREASRTRQMYEAFLQQTMASRVSEAFENLNLGGRVSVLEPADRPLEPVRPKRGLVLLVSLASGILLGLAALFMVEYQDSSYRSVDELERDLDVPVLATLPRIRELRSGTRKGGFRSLFRPRGIAPSTGGPADGAAFVLSLCAAESPGAHEMRKLLLAMRSRESSNALPRSLLVTSAHTGEGKTLSAFILAAELARYTEGSVALVDLDLRRPRLHKMLQLQVNGADVKRSLASNEPIPLIPLLTGKGSLSVLPGGAPADVPSDLLTVERIRELVARLRETFDYVVIDGPPCVLTPDPLILGQAVEATLYVVRPGAVPRDAVRRGLRMQRASSGTGLLGIIVNDVGEMLPYHYRYHYGRGSYTLPLAGTQNRGQNDA